MSGDTFEASNLQAEVKWLRETVAFLRNEVSFLRNELRKSGYRFADIRPQAPKPEAEVIGEVNLDAKVTQARGSDGVDIEKVISCIEGTLQEENGAPVSGDFWVAVQLAVEVVKDQHTAIERERRNVSILSGRLAARDDTMRALHNKVASVKHAIRNARAQVAKLSQRARAAETKVAHYRELLQGSVPKRRSFGEAPQELSPLTADQPSVAKRSNADLFHLAHEMFVMGSACGIETEQAESATLAHEIWKHHWRRAKEHMAERWGVKEVPINQSKEQKP